MSLVASPALDAVAARRGLSRLALHRCLLWTVALGLGVLTTIELGLTAAMLVYPGELMYGEAILFDHARRIVEGLSLYQPIDRLPYTVASYTPLFYWLAAATQWLSGTALAPGRVLAVLAFLVATGLVGSLATLEGRGWRSGALAGALFFALGAPGSGVIPWTALYKEDSLALALTLGSLCLVARGRRPPRVLLAAALAALAILTKQTYAAAIAGEIVWVFRHDRRLGGAMLIGTVVPVIAVSGYLEATTGAFLANTVLANINPFRMDWLSSNLVLLLLFQGGPMLAATVGMVANRRTISSTTWLLLSSWLSAAVPMLAIAKLGGASNHWLMFAAVGAVLAAWAVLPGQGSRLRVSHCVAAVALAGGLLAVVPVAAGTWLTSLHTIRPSSESASQLQQLVERVRAEPRTVLADPVDVVVLADKEPLFEPLLLSIFAADGRWDVQPIVDRVCGGQIGLLVVDRPISALDWPEPLRAALLDRMRIESSVAGLLVYTPSPTASGGACS